MNLNLPKIIRKGERLIEYCDKCSGGSEVKLRIRKGLL